MGRSQRPIAVHVLTRLVLGGPTRPVLAGLDRLARRGFRTVLVTGAAADHEVEARECLADYPDLPVLRLRCLVRRPAPHRDLRALGTLAAAVRRLGPLVVHTHTAKAGCLGRLATLAAGRGLPRVVHTFHGHSLTRPAAGALAPFWRQLERLLARRTDLIVTLSPSQREEIGRLLGRAAARRAAVVPLGCDLTAGGAACEQERWGTLRRADHRLLAFLGRGVPVKQLDRLAEAHARACALAPAELGRLRIVVAGPVEPRVRGAVDAILRAAGLADRWEFVGPVLRPLAFLSRVDGLALPSRSEGTPVAVIEALATGLPVLASAVGGLPEMLCRDWIQQAPGRWRTAPAAPRGRLLPPGESGAWARALVDFARDPASVPGDRGERSAFARRVFDADARTEELARLYGAIDAAAPSRAARAGARSRPVAPTRALPDQPRPAL